MSILRLFCTKLYLLKNKVAFSCFEKKVKGKTLVIVGMSDFDHTWLKDFGQTYRGLAMLQFPLVMLLPINSLDSLHGMRILFGSQVTK